MDSIIENAPVGVLVTRNRRVESYNAKFSEIFRCAGQSLIGRPTTDLFISDESYHAFSALATSVLSKGQPLQTEWFLKKKNGEIIWTWLIGYVLDPRNPTDGTVWFFEDRTAQKQAEDALQQALFENETILDTMGSGVAALEERMIVRCNRRLEEMFGYASGELAGCSTRIFYDSDDAYEATGTEIYSHLRKTGHYSGEFQMQKKGGGKLWCRLVIRAPDKHNPFHGAVCLYDDFSERKAVEIAIAEAKDKAEQATMVKSRFLANMSHEIRTPMNAIIGLSHLVLQTELTERQKDYLVKIKDSGTRLLGVINDILDFSKIESGKIGIERIAFDLHKVIEDVACIASQQAHSRGVELLLDIPRATPRFLFGDPLRLGQVLTNLLSNAVKFTSVGTVTLKAQASTLDNNDVRIEFQIADTGIGMTPDQIEKLFQPFTQADGSMTRQYGGTGLGLSISKHLVELMGGTIAVHSNRGVGSTFSFKLAFGIDDSKSECAPALTGLRALLADDNSAAREVLSKLLKSFGLRLDVFGSGAEAVSAMQDAPPCDPYQLVVLDWSMPEMSGLDVIRWMRSQPQLTVQPKSVLVTAYSRDDLDPSEANLFADSILYKPIGASAMASTLGKLFGGTEPQNAHNQTEAPSLTTIDLSGMRVLLAEDNHINQQIANELLTGCGAWVDIVDNGVDAVNRALSGVPYDIVLLDLQMPLMDGYEAALRIRSELAGDSPPVVAMTAHSLVSDRERCLDAGMSAHVAKPIDPNEFLAIVGRYKKPIGDRLPDFQKPDSVCQKIDSTHDISIARERLLDIDSGLARVMGNRYLYAALLREFMETQLTAAEQIRCALDSNDHLLAIRLAHTLCGVAGNIGASPIARRASEIESSIQESHSATSAPGLLESLARLLERFRSEVLGEHQELLQPSNRDNRTTSQPSQPADSVVEELDRLLQRADCTALSYLQANLHTMSELVGDETTGKITTHIQKYRYEDAASILRTVISAMRRNR